MPNAAEALGELEAAASTDDPYKLILSDYCMPVMDGLTLARQVMLTPAIKDTAMILMTSAPSKGDAKVMHEAGFSGYLTKPIFPNELPMMLAAVWQAHKQGDTSELITRHNLTSQDRTAPEKELSLKGTQILLAEDNPVNRMVATKSLERYGCLVTPAGNGLEAVEQVKMREFVCLRWMALKQQKLFAISKEVKVKHAHQSWLVPPMQWLKTRLSA